MSASMRKSEPRWKLWLLELVAPWSLEDQKHPIVAAAQLGEVEQR